MPRRIPDYPDMYAGWNYVSSAGAILTAVSVVFWIFLALYTLMFGRKAAGNPWGESANTLEWTLSSPPPFHQFEIQPRVL